MKNLQIGNYAIESVIGQGGMGRVYLGVHRVIGSRAAIKVLQGQIVSMPEMAERFLREARAATRAEHPCIVKILDYGRTVEGLPYLAMEYLDGQPLSKYLTAQSRLSLAETLHIGEQLSSALSTAHSKQVVHRDLKPENIIRMNGDEMFGSVTVKIVDFGIARIDTPSDLEKLTRTGAFLGTPCYMAPEVVMDPRRASDRSDVYALGVILFQMLSGELPFTGNSLGEVVLKHMTQKPPFLSDRAPNTPAPLSLLVRRMLAKEPGQRPTMRMVTQAIRQIKMGLAELSRRKADVWSTRSHPSRLKRVLAWSIPSLLVGAVALGLTREPTKAIHEKKQSTVVTDPSGIRSTTLADKGPPRMPVVDANPEPEPNSEPPHVERPKAVAPTHNPEPRLRSSSFVPESPHRAETPPPKLSETDSSNKELLRPWTLRDPFYPPLPAASGSVMSSADTLRSSAEKALLDAAEARSQGSLHKAIERARMATLGLPDSGWWFVGALGCEARDLAAAQESYRHLDKTHRACLEDTCRYFGVVRSKEQWRVDVALRKSHAGKESHLALEDAEQSYRERMYDRSIESARLALGYQHYDAWQVIGRSACMKADTQLASEALCRLEPMRQRNVRYACRKNHIDLPNS